LQNHNKKIFILFCILAALFLLGLVRLFMLRFEKGDIYPAYSSLRSDPLGTKGFYEGLKNLPPLSINRNYHPLSKLTAEANTTLVYLGAQQYERDFYLKKSLNLFERISASGGRVVISFQPVKTTSQPEAPPERAGKKADENEAGQKKKMDPKGSSKKEQTGDRKKHADLDAPKRGCQMKHMTEHWGFGFGYEKSRVDGGKAAPVKGLHDDTRLPPVSWHTTRYFEKLHEDWRVIYTRNSHPVIIEKDLGKGTIVLSADSYLFSNEAMLKERLPQLLTWFMGGNNHVVFDESHFGIKKNPGIADLARKYRLHWLFLGIVVFAGLFVWKNSTCFVPLADDNNVAGISDSTSLRDQTEGLISLLRRNIRTGDILSVCAEEWKKSFVTEKEVSKETAESFNKIKSVIDTEKLQSGKQGSPVRA